MRLCLQALTLVAGIALGFCAFAGAAGSKDSRPDDPISAQLVRESVVGTVELMNKIYVYPETARRVGTEMLRRLDAGAYDHIASKQEFANRISAELVELTGDGHMGVMVAEGKAPPTHVLQETVDRFRLNYGFQRVEVLDGNIGYLKLNKFHQDEQAERVADHALAFLGDTAALIIDLTECKGGSPELVRHLLSHFFADGTSLWSIVNRDGEVVHAAVAKKGIGSGRFKRDYPLFVLTGPDTASAAELFAYTLQSSGKAKTVGQGTTGIAHLVGAQAINEHFTGRFSTYRNTNPVTGSDWERVGIKPDNPAAPEDRLATATRMAVEAIARQ
ncbi:MAG: S41 family peptidase [Rhodanobacteraceae bacterium]|nr:S41 family peptidase [Rhodanobacteraceae bacterium]